MEAGRFDDLLAANADYAKRHTRRAMDAVAAKRVAVLTCMDVRIDPLAMLGLRPGDAIVLRNAGGRITEDVLRSLILAEALLGVERLMLIGHTRCRLTAVSDDAVRASIRAAGRPDPGDTAFLTAPDPAAAVCAELEKLRSSPQLGRLGLGGFLYDVDTGTLSRLC